MMLLMVMVSHLSWSQYPMIKKLGNDEVVIMTVKQGEDINNQFSKLKDSISDLKNTINSFRINNINLLKTNTSLIDSLNKTNQTLIVSNNDLRWYREESLKYKNNYISVSKEQRATVIGAGIVSAVFITIMVILSKNF